MNQEQLLNYEQASKMLGLAKGTVYAMVHQNRIPHIRLGRRLVRFDRAELQKFVDAHRVEARTA
jgi:excisionase family DNA binding protein